MVIVSGPLYVDPDARSSYLEGCRELMQLARRAPGCLDFYLSADPLDDRRINVYECWESVADVEAFRGSGPPDDQTTAIVDARVVQHEIASSVEL